MEYLWLAISAVIIGVVIGYLGRLVVPGRQDISFVATALIGIGAALLGGWIANLLGVGDTDGIDWIKLIIQIGLAMVGVGFWSGAFFRK